MQLEPDFNSIFIRFNEKFLLNKPLWNQKMIKDFAVDGFLNSQVFIEMPERLCLFLSCYFMSFSQ